MSDVSIGDKFKVHIREEHAPEYKKFKQVSGEDQYVADYLKKNTSLSANGNVLDVDGREGNVSLNVYEPTNVTIIDPDPTRTAMFANVAD